MAFARVEHLRPLLEELRSVLEEMGVDVEEVDKKVEEQKNRILALFTAQDTANKIGKIQPSQTYGGPDEKTKTALSSLKYKTSDDVASQVFDFIKQEAESYFNASKNMKTEKDMLEFFVTGYYKSLLLLQKLSEEKGISQLLNTIRETESVPAGFNLSMMLRGTITVPLAFELGLVDKNNFTGEEVKDFVERIRGAIQQTYRLALGIEGAPSEEEIKRSAQEIIEKALKGEEIPTRLPVALAYYVLGQEGEEGRGIGAYVFRIASEGAAENPEGLLPGDPKIQEWLTKLRKSEEVVERE